jgi:hypothetical protein
MDILKDPAGEADYPDAYKAFAEAVARGAVGTA